MLEDKMLLWKLKVGNANAISSVYEKYKHDMLRLAVTLARDRMAGEDIVHDVFVSFVRISQKLGLGTNLRAYLMSSVANRVRNMGRIKSMETLSAESNGVNSLPADCAVIEQEQERLIEHAMAQLPYDQHEIIVLHLQVGMKFREIASYLGLSINTIQSRYRYGLEKLRISLNGKGAP